ncbi:MAG TPA: polysaccharide ABC transporter ATP-binding protein [Chthoniobacteraceae bacterium]|jgi:lipopolysaccharide transport system ATP-binding protein|nr:polysaccharide ABC transporter ATP-binding protein [Chthoniobacteraceae bacterium]
MSDVVIRVESLSKKYVIGRQRGASSGDGLRHAVQDAVAAPFRRIKSAMAARRTDPGSSTCEPASFRNPQSAIRNSEDFYALRDISFEVKRGEVLGIIGRNGAGKSTLLKILSRITEPTTGRIGLKGRVASLLEVGTGFHPELTGRENIYLNGSILGMSRKEVSSKFDEIVDFAGVEQFLLTPVKHYSSGMYVRLAFAVAAHLEPEILIVDEVLAVGDVEFQKKCIGKIKQVAGTHGRTVLFVSHNMGAVEALCDTALHLAKGQTVYLGTAVDALQSYRKAMQASSTVFEQPERTTIPSNGYLISSIRAKTDCFAPREDLEFTAKLICPTGDARCHFSMHIHDESDTNVTTISTEFLEGVMMPPGASNLVVRIQSPWLTPGVYRVNAFLYGAGLFDNWDDACRFEIGPGVAKGGYSIASSRNAGQALSAFTVSGIPG